jgi:hypothetical protein
MRPRQPGSWLIHYLSGNQLLAAAILVSAFSELGEHLPDFGILGLTRAMELIALASELAPSISPKSQTLLL